MKGFDVELYKYPRPVKEHIVEDCFEIVQVRSFTEVFQITAITKISNPSKCVPKIQN